jgi:hypothetical protein
MVFSLFKIYQRMKNDKSIKSIKSQQMITNKSDWNILKRENRDVLGLLLQVQIFKSLRRSLLKINIRMFLKEKLLPTKLV